MIVLLLLVQAAVHHDLPCNCIEGNIRNSCLYRRRYCALSYWYGKTKDGKSWLAGESGCATGCSKISVPGVDGGPDICLTPLQRKDLTPMSQNGFGRSENVIFSLTDFVGTACDGEAAVAQAGCMVITSLFDVSSVFPLYLLRDWVADGVDSMMM